MSMSVIKIDLFIDIAIISAQVQWCIWREPMEEGTILMELHFLRLILNHGIVDYDLVVLFNQPYRYTLAKD